MLTAVQTPARFSRWVQPPVRAVYVEVKRALQPASSPAGFTAA